MPDHAANQFNLVADIGGTNTRVALADAARLLPDTVAKFANQDFADLGSVLRRYIDNQGGVDCAGACVAVAGPVRDGAGHLTNLDWSIDRALLADATSAEKVAVLNDLQAQGHGLAELPGRALCKILRAPTPVPNAVKLVVNIGTGFNAAVVYDAPGSLLVPPSECGHCDLALQTREDVALADLIRRDHGFCGIDDVLSGRGLERIYAFHSAKPGSGATRRAAEIMAAVADNSDPVAAKTTRHFVHLTAIAVGNLALSHLPFGGVYLSGGVARAFAPYFIDLGFEAAFKNKGRFAEFMANFAVSVIEDDNAALAGCANYLQSIR